MLGDAYRQGKLSARGHERILRVARTVADLDDCDRVHAGHVKQALTMRQDVIRDEAMAA
jgi:magnesium chelatase family protein